MNQPPTNICPLLAIASIDSTSNPPVCIEECCALWNFAGSECALVSIPYAISDISDGLAAHSHKCGGHCSAAETGEKRKETE